MCGNPPPSHDKPLHVMFDGSLLLRLSCFSRELEHRKRVLELRA